MTRIAEHFRELERASRQLEIIEANRDVIAHTNFEGTAPGSEEAARRYIERTGPIIAELKEMLR